MAWHAFTRLDAVVADDVRDAAGACYEAGVGFGTPIEVILGVGAGCEQEEDERLK